MEEEYDLSPEVLPVLDDVPEDDEAEPLDAGIEHTASVEEVEENVG